MQTAFEAVEPEQHVKHHHRRHHKEDAEERNIHSQFAVEQNALHIVMKLSNAKKRAKIIRLQPALKYLQVGTIRLFSFDLVHFTYDIFGSKCLVFAIRRVNMCV